MTLLEQVKLLLGITGEGKDALLGLLCSNVTAQAKTYCRISNVSDVGLQGAIADMIVTRYRARGYGQEAVPKAVSSISEGDVSIGFKTAQYNATGELTDSERQTLSQYRRVWP